MPEPISETAQRYEAFGILATDSEARTFEASHSHDAKRLADAYCTERPKLIAALRAAEATLNIAIRAGLDGFCKKNEDFIVNNHCTMKVIREALTLAGEA